MYKPSKAVTELQEVILQDEWWVQKVNFQHNKRLAPMLRDSDKPLTEEQKDRILQFWDEKTNGVYRPDLTWYQFYYSRTGIEDPAFIDNTLQYYLYIDNFNDKRYATFKDKNYVAKLFPEINQPETIAMNICGYYYDAQYNMISKAEFEKICTHQETDFVIKPSYGTSGGDSVTFVSKETEEAEIKKALSGYSKNYVVQYAVKQHKDLTQIAPNSINTIRLLTFLVDGEIRPLSAVLRMGIGTAKVDNLSFGGIACGIDKNGVCTKYAIDKYGNMFDRHPDSGHIFENTKIPNYSKVLELAETLHKKLPMFGNIAWDIAIDEKGDAVLIEFNTWYTQLALHQVSNGPTYGDSFNDILDMIMKKVHIELPEERGMSMWAYKDEVKIKSIKKKCGSSISVPAEIVGRPVSTIMNKACTGNKSLKDIKLQSIRRIGSKAFSGCEKLRRVELGENLRTIGAGAFENCKSLDTVIFRRDTASDLSKAFKGCDNLKVVCGPPDSKVQSFAKMNDLEFREFTI